MMLMWLLALESLCDLMEFSVLLIVLEAPGLKDMVMIGWSWSPIGCVIKVSSFYRYYVLLIVLDRADIGLAGVMVNRDLFLDKWA